METNCFLSILILCFLLHFSISCSLTDLTIDEDALLTLKTHVANDPNNILASNWSKSTSVCNWIGITCGVRHHRVVALNISYLGLTGTIPPQLGNLSFLASLAINNNSFYGSLPDELARLHRLKYVNFNHNQLSGNVPSSIFNMSSMQEIRLKHNLFSSIVNISSCGSNLMLLDLSENMFEGEIPSFISKCRQLQRLTMSSNNFSGSIPRAFGNLTEIRMLLIEDTKLQGEIPYEISNLHNLEFLALADNYLVGLIPAPIFNISTLKMIAVSNNTLSGSLPSSNALVLPNLEMLELTFNNFSGTFPSFITNSSKLKYLEMGGNSFSGYIPITIGNRLTSLEWLGLAFNYFTSSTTDLSFFTSLSNSKNLRAVVLSANPLNGFLPGYIGNLSISLETIYMKSCNISGSIPEEIGNLKNLMMLDLSINEVTGSIPITLKNLQNLQGLSLEYNKLEGFILDDLCHLDNLVELYLESNKLSGAIPACLGHLTSLRLLLLGSNRLTSVIPSSLWKLKDIVHLNLSSNSLMGNLPLDFGNMKVVIDVDLSRNHLTGEIPGTIGSLQDLQFLSLRYNSIQGLIPESIGRLTSLEILDLSNNNLSGVIPKSLEALKYLKYLNLSFNQLEGRIPTEGAFANFSGKSFVMNHALCGLLEQQVPPCKSSTRPKSRISVVLAITLPLTFIVFITLIIVLSTVCRKRRSKQPPNNNDIDVSRRAIWRRISYQELVRATDSFSERNLLGRGSFGSVFKGRLLDGIEVAVKVFHLQFERSLKSFDVECEVMSSIRHRNLVKIISSCTNEDLKALVLEYMPTGSLEKCLYSDEYFLDLLQRLNIMIDIASALEYLHSGYSIPVVHCDVKPSNVLLDQNMVAHLSDFGIAKLLGEEESMTQTQTLATIGYMAPEYGREGKISTKGDVYSYGVMLMETFTKKKPTDEIFIGEMSLRRWVGDSLNHSIMEVVDHELLLGEDVQFPAREHCLLSILSLAMNCTIDLPENRIDIKNVVTRLTKIRATFLSTRGA
ncbi:hypothetical protein JRO89_XS02G0287100 [Xanthoceras sorbifolium]|uniref:Protein kinase domain-containing protein n=1 Tax=Xanthoceras sorbifolium TaxID=99658 RepID=A0ABQ8IHA8_9ROSI|nr:hypothetical protein JRO89_XS02G0287100 [Xanthoceras sorbifolium]